MDTNISEYLTNDYKVYVDVIEERSKDGSVRPLSFVWEDGRTYEIDRVIDFCPGHSLKAGGYGIRYTIEVNGKRSFMFFEADRWFMEKK